MKAAILSLLAPVAMATTVNLCGQYDTHDSGDYYVNNNAWGLSYGTGDQCTVISSISSDGVTWDVDWTWSGGEDNVKGYPYAGRTLDEKKLVSEITEIPTKAQWQYNGTDVRANVAYDLFTAADSSHDTSSGDYELMIWLADLGEVYPIGDSTGTVEINGTEWELYVGYNGSMKVFSFVAATQQETFDQDLVAFFDHITDAQSFPASEQYLLTMQFGTEAFTGTSSCFNVGYWYGDVN